MDFEYTWTWLLPDLLHVYGAYCSGMSMDGGDDDLDIVMDTTCQVIKWTPYQPPQWAPLIDDTGQEL